MKNHFNVSRGDGTATPDTKFSDYCVNLKYIMQKKSRKIKKNMEKAGRYSKWPLTSIGDHPYQNQYIYIPGR
jgi:DNA gyrase inhibitor GyrI